MASSSKPANPHVGQMATRYLHQRDVGLQDVGLLGLHSTPPTDPPTHRPTDPTHSNPLLTEPPTNPPTHLHRRDVGLQDVGLLGLLDVVVVEQPDQLDRDHVVPLELHKLGPGVEMVLVYGDLQ